MVLKFYELQYTWHCQLTVLAEAAKIKTWLPYIQHIIVLVVKKEIGNNFLLRLLEYRKVAAESN